MSFYDDASLIMYPSGYKEDKLYSLKPTNGDGDLTFTRASSATRVNSEGLIEDVPYNLASYSNDLDQWIKSDATATSGQSGYDGSNDAWLVTSTVTNGHVRRNITLEGELTFSVYAKAGTADGIRIRLDASSDRNLYVNLSTGTLIIDGTNIGYNIENVGNDWYRISSINNLDSLINYRIYPVDATGSGVVGTIYVQDTQLVRGSEAKAYFETTDGLNVPRIDYTGGGCGKLLLEPQRTNTVLHNSDYTQSWSLTNVIPTANATISPNGSNDAQKLTSANTFGQHYIRQTIGGHTVGAPHVYSCFAKAGELDILSLRLLNGGGQTYTNFDLTNGTHDGGVNGKMIDFGNGWWRCISYHASSTSSALYPYIYTQVGNQQGDGVSGFYVYGAMIEEGTYETSIINTSGSTVTRVADSASKTGISSLINSPEGVLYAEMAQLSDDSSIVGSELSISDGTLNNDVRIVSSPITAANSVFIRIDVGGVRVATFNYTGVTITDFNKIAVKWKVNDFALWINGVEVASDLSGVSFPASTLSTLNTTGPNGTSPLQANVQSLMVFPSALTDDELETLTTL